MPYTIIDLLSELADASIAVATSTLANSLSPSDLSSKNELLRKKLSKARQNLQARESELSDKLQLGSAQCAELERSLDRSKPQLQELEINIAKLKAEHTKALENLAH